MNNRQKIAERREIAERGQTPIAIKYCLYSRKSSEQDELQALSIESQIKEMLLIAEKESLNIVEIYRESHSAKESGQRPVFNQMLADIRSGKFNGILTWHPDRISRNAGDLGIIVDFLDAKKLIEIRTYSQKFTNNPSEKFLFMILGSQAKLENDNKSVNVKRGLKTKCEMGLWPGVAPTAYLNSKNVDEKGVIFLDPVRAPLIKQVFEKIAYDGWSGRKAYLWMTNDIKFTTKKGKKLSLGNLYLLLKNSFYTGTFEYPRGSGKFFKGKHKPIITQEVFDLVQKKLEQNYDYERNKEFAFTRLMICGICGSGITADEKWKTQKNGNNHRYVYYVCCKSQDRQTSIYAFAQTVFGNVIRLVEHFRCAPDIIAFSNALSYGGEIKPLREETSISLHPNVIPHRVEGLITEEKTNNAEIEAITSLICSAIEQPEFKKKTFGVITLRGDRAMATVFNRLNELGILPERETSVVIDPKSSELIDRVRCRAQELQIEWKNQLETVRGGILTVPLQRIQTRIYQNIPFMQSLG